MLTDGAADASVVHGDDVFLLLDVLADEGVVDGDAPNSFSITAMSLPWSPLRMWLTSVVLPEPRKPVTI